MILNDSFAFSGYDFPIFSIKYLKSLLLTHYLYFFFISLTNNLGSIIHNI